METQRNPRSVHESARREHQQRVEGVSQSGEAERGARKSIEKNQLRI